MILDTVIEFQKLHSPVLCKNVRNSMCIQEWCVLEECCTTLVCHPAGGLVVLCLALTHVTLTTVPRAVAVQSAVTMTTFASAVCNCKTSPPHISS